MGKILRCKKQVSVVSDQPRSHTLETILPILPQHEICSSIRGDLSL